MLWCLHEGTDFTGHKELAVKEEPRASHVLSEGHGVLGSELTDGLRDGKGYSHLGGKGPAFR